jgi:hypothetical protein
MTWHGMIEVEFGLPCSPHQMPVEVETELLRLQSCQD